MGSKRELVTFEMLKPKLNDSNQILSFKVRDIGKKNKDLLTGLRNKCLSDASLFIDDALMNWVFVTWCEGLGDDNVFTWTLLEAVQSVTYEYHFHLSNALWNNTTCPNGDINSGNSPCTAEQLSFQSRITSNRRTRLPPS